MGTVDVTTDWRSAIIWAQRVIKRPVSKPGTLVRCRYHLEDISGALSTAGCPLGRAVVGGKGMVVHVH